MLETIKYVMDRRPFGDGFPEHQIRSAECKTGNLAGMMAVDNCIDRYLYGKLHAAMTQMYAAARVHLIYGRTNEIMKNLIARTL